ncbi:MAG: LysR family transcriptional regulator [Pseudomonadota bacterium]
MTKALDRLTLLDTFVRIAERGSISAAARDLNLSQASASRQLKELETRFGAELIRRTTHSLALTQAGQELLTDARDMLARWEGIEERHMEGGDAMVRGPLKVIGPVALGQLYLADIALDFQMAHPAVSLTWDLDDRPIRFAETGCDCWIKVGPVPDETLILKPLGKIERLVVAHPSLLESGAFESPDDVARLPFLALSPYEGGRPTLVASDRGTEVIEPEIAVSTNNIFALYRAALKGVGAAVLPKWFVEADLQAGRLVDVLPDWRAPDLTISAAYLPARHQPRRLSLFLDALQEQVPKIPGIG